MRYGLVLGAAVVLLSSGCGSSPTSAPADPLDVALAACDAFARNQDVPKALRLATQASEADSRYAPLRRNLERVRRGDTAVSVPNILTDCQYLAR